MKTLFRMTAAVLLVVSLLFVSLPETAGAAEESAENDLSALLAGAGARQCVCVGGFSPGKGCYNNSGCPSACVGGSKSGKKCVNDINCPAACVGGFSPGKEC